MLPFLNSHTHQVSQSDAVRTLRPHEVADRETELVGSRPLVLPASRAGHVQHLHAGFVRHAVDSAYAERVEPVFLRHAEAVTIELGQSAGAGPDRQACRTQGFEKRPPGGVDRCGVSQWCLEPLSNAGQKLGLPFEEFLNRPGPLLLVAFDARDRQIRKTVGTASRLRNDVLHVERHTALCAVDAPASELLQEVLLEFIAGKFALLILDAGDLRVLHPLRVKLHEFLSNPAHGRKPAKTVDPGERRVDAVLKRRRQPSLRFASIQEPGSAIAEIAAPAAAPQLTPRRQGVSDRGSAVLEIDEVERVMRFFLILPNDRDAGLLRARIDLHDDLLHDRIGKRPVDDADREGLQFVYAGPAGLQELSRSCGPTGHQRFVVLVQDKDFHHVRLPYGY